jgi:hypothetical protein
MTSAVNWASSFQACDRNEPEELRLTDQNNLFGPMGQVF